MRPDGNVHIYGKHIRRKYNSDIMISVQSYLSLSLNIKELDK